MVRGDVVPATPSGVGRARRCCSLECPAGRCGAGVTGAGGRESRLRIGRRVPVGRSGCGPTEAGWVMFGGSPVGRVPLAHPGSSPCVSCQPDGGKLPSLAAMSRTIDWHRSVTVRSAEWAELQRLGANHRVTRWGVKRQVFADSSGCVGPQRRPQLPTFARLSGRCSGDVKDPRRKKSERGKLKNLRLCRVGHPSGTRNVAWVPHESVSDPIFPRSGD